MRSYVGNRCVVDNGGILGVAVAIAWVCLSFRFQESFAALLEYVLLLLPSAASAAGTWAICRLWQRRSLARRSIR